MPHPIERYHAWPYFRQDPDCVVLDVRPGHEPSPKPPVRIFLGTEEAQYRAERIFFYSIEQVRDPSRVYEIHLMNNIRGFDRRKWRTGFTNYRYAIPEFAGFEGKAIYNDVDQIYLADPALLFDLEMASHGYLSISAQDTSVMLIDCVRMRSMWNRETASKFGKYQLITKNSKIPGLWGKLDPHWNARDQEYAEGETKCLHYTALHQQPWNPFPEVFSYHLNPLAYIWHDLEREADRDGYEVFTLDNPSPDFPAVLGRNEEINASGQNRVDPSIEALLDEHDAQYILTVSAQAQKVTFGDILNGRDQTHFALGPATPWPEHQFDAVIIAELLEHVPPADLPWLLGQIFASARSLVCIQVAASEPEGLGSSAWWQRRVDEVAKRYPGANWHLHIDDKSAPIPGIKNALTVRRTDDFGTPKIWSLLDGDVDGDREVAKLAEALGWPVETKHLSYRMHLGAFSPKRDPSVSSLDEKSAAVLTGPWPDLVIAAGEYNAPVSAWIAKQGTGKTRVVQLGSPQAPFALFDLIVTWPQQNLPIRENVLHATAMIAGADTAEHEEALASWDNELARFERPWSTLVVGNAIKPSIVNADIAKKLAKSVGETMHKRGGQLLVWLDSKLPARVREALLSNLKVQYQIANDLNGQNAPASSMALLAASDHCIISGDSAAHLSAACLSGKPVEIFAYPKWYDGLPMAKTITNGLGVLTGGGTTYRGTPHQQHVLGRFIDGLVTRGLISPSTDMGAFHRGLIGRGLATNLVDGTIMSSRKPLDDLDLIITRIRELMSETRTVT